MDFKEALAAIKKLENGAELVSAIEAETERLNTKNFEVIGEKRNATSKLTAYETALTAIATALGVEGDAEAVLANTEAKVRAIAGEAAQLRTDKAALETRATEAEGKVKGLERKTKISDAAAKSGANAAVLERLLGDKIDELAIAEDGVKVGDKLLKDYIEADEGLKPFVPALFPSSTEQKQEPEKKPAPQPKLPSSAPTAGQGDKPDLLATYAAKNYGGAKALTATKAKSEE
ncbi:hypothetical protein ACQ4M4_12935 [Leptolyngbya sp. AN02str]|uniref:hypothetical protein n=1 Tax=Leptolyngbya sp. AN02str TaxID=3423363 RepID=UPI003D323566